MKMNLCDQNLQDSLMCQQKDKQRFGVLISYEHFFPILQFKLLQLLSQTFHKFVKLLGYQPKHPNK